MDPSIGHTVMATYDILTNNQFAAGLVDGIKLTTPTDLLEMYDNYQFHQWSSILTDYKPKYFSRCDENAKSTFFKWGLRHLEIVMLVQNRNGWTVCKMDHLNPFGGGGTVFISE